MNWLARGALVAALLSVGCSDGNNNNGNNDGGGGPSTSCTSGAKECVGDKVARQCQSDGHWAAFKCVGGHCTDGNCIADEVMPPEEQICFPGEGACQGTMALTCNATGTAYTATACPSGTTCAGPGLCQGTCVIGQSLCYDNNNVATCLDGKSYTTTACAADTFCVGGDNGVVSTASCKPAECTPSFDGCSAVCGDKKNGGGDPTKSVSRCVETPAGYKWEVLPCPGTSSCSPGVSACGFASAPRAEAACVTTCIEGAQRCGETTGTVETCTGGAWVAAACASGKVCVVDAADPLKASCGDAACASGVGVCTPDGKFIACAAGVVGSTATDCATGICVADAPPGGPITGNVTGRCSTLCTEGEGRCVDTGSGQRCKNGRWEEQVLCPDSNALCFSAVMGGVRQIGCYSECFPGTKSCTTNGLIRTCKDDGTFDTATQCAMGTCDDEDGPATCVLECLPGQIECDDQENDALPSVFFATVTCSAEGRWGDPENCTGDLRCRYGFGGNALGCVECAAQNEIGQPDSRCNEDSTAVQTCTATNTWNATTLACTGETSCVPAEEVENYPTFAPSCGISNSQLIDFLGIGCEFIDSGVSPCGTTPDCCTVACDAPNGQIPAPAHCEIVN